MAVVLFFQLIILLLTGCIIGQAERNFNHAKRQVYGEKNREIGIPQRNSDRSMVSNDLQFSASNNPSVVNSNDQSNQQQSNNNLLESSQGQSQVARSQGFYNSPEFKPPSFSGEKPVGWFDTKYPNWISDQNAQLDTNNVIDGKNEAPSSLMGKSIQSKPDDNGPALLQKLANFYASKGDKEYNMHRFADERGFGSTCINRQNFNGYTFGKFRCPLPHSGGMNRLDRYCCGPEKSQYCCTAQEFSQSQNAGHGDNNNYGKHRHPKYPYYSRRTHITLAIVLPIVCFFVIAIAGVIIFLYYKKLQKNKNKTPGAKKSNDKYSAVPRDAPLERPVSLQDEHQESSVQP